MYNYKKAVREDLITFIEENYTAEEIAARIEEDRDAFAEEIQEKAWISDSVTGNASGSYTFSTWEAEGNLCHNFELIEAAAEEFGAEPVISAGYEHGAEWWDVTIRCYMLPHVIEAAIAHFE